MVINSLLSRSANNPPKLEDIWYLMDRVWNEFGCDNEKFDWNKINKFYRHPVWILNGLFIERDEISMQHRHAISNWIIKEKPKRILDYGGGFGTLARLIAGKDSNILIDIYEPHPSAYAISRIADYPNIHSIDSIDKTYDVLISIDVIEHVPEPLKLLSDMVNLTKEGGYLIIANNFFPVIKCHLPSTFHLRYTFNKFAKLMGLTLIGPCVGSHASIYCKKKTIPCDWKKIRFYERVSRILFPFLKTTHLPCLIFNKAFRKVLS